MKAIAKLFRLYLKALFNVGIAVVFLSIILAGINFPHDTDAPLTQQEIDAAKKYYAEAYARPGSNSPANSEYESFYLGVAEIAAKRFKIKEQVSDFVDRYNLKKAPVLEIGSGRGYLQDVADNYTGLDISSNVARFYHKKFVLGSATALPFADNSFDGVWSIWVFEHVPNPEQALREARRVLRDKGVMLLLPAWNADAWAADGYPVRPYSDFGLGGKLIKASVPIRSSKPYRALTTVPVRLLRTITPIGPTTLRYRRLTPNYERYWMPDSDAVNSIDSHEAALWFLSRGDECLNRGRMSIFGSDEALLIRVNKKTPETSYQGLLG